MSDEQLPRPTADDRNLWRTHWQALGMLWRTEPEIDEERQRFLAERRAIHSHIEKGAYPFHGEHGSITLTRADVEWLLATHESGGMVGPVDWSDGHQREREGLDLRGADMREADLSGLPLARLRAGLSREERATASVTERLAAAAALSLANLQEAHLEGAYLSEAQLEGVFLNQANLRGATLIAAHLESAYLIEAQLQSAQLDYAHLAGAVLIGARLEGSSLRGAQLEGKLLPLPVGASARRARLPAANLQGAAFDVTTTVSSLALGDAHQGAVSLADVRWGGLNLAVLGWSRVTQLGDETQARQRHTSEGTVKDRATRLAEFQVAVRANRQLATALRNHGLNEDADRFAYRAQVLRRQVLRRHGRWGRACASWLLDVISGYGYSPLRGVITYLLVVAGFAAAYFSITNFAIPQLASTHLTSLAWYEALVLSISSFHGGGLFPSALALGTPIAILAAAEAIIGLLIEITFIVTFTQRFFAR